MRQSVSEKSIQWVLTPTDTRCIASAMSHLKPIYDVWDGNAEALATDIGEQGVTVRQWRNRGNIPPRYWPKIINAAAAKGCTLEWQQFVAPDGVQDDFPLAHLSTDTTGEAQDRAA